MLPTIDKRATGVNLRRIMDERGLTVKDIQQYLGLGSVQSIYHWLNGISMPTLDNLYALSGLFRVPVDELLRGDRRKLPSIMEQRQYNRLLTYSKKISEMWVA